MSLKKPSKELEVIMVVSSRIQELMSCVMTLKIDINSRLIDMASSMFSEYNVSHSFWAEAIDTACYCNNHLYCHPLKEKTPYDLLNGRKPNIAYF
jgi:hypothetical protein